MRPQKYRKKPVVIEAMGPLGRGNWRAVRDWCDGTLIKGSITERYVMLRIKTLEGTMNADEGDYVIRGVKGEFYPCKPDIFAATYEPVGAEVTSTDSDRDVLDAAGAWADEVQLRVDHGQTIESPDAQQTCDDGEDCPL